MSCALPSISTNMAGVTCSNGKSLPPADLGRELFVAVFHRAGKGVNLPAPCWSDEAKTLSTAGAMSRPAIGAKRLSLPKSITHRPQRTSPGMRGM